MSKSENPCENREDLPANYIFWTKGSAYDGEVIHYIQVDEYRSAKVPVHRFYKPISRVIPSSRIYKDVP